MNKPTLTLIIIVALIFGISAIKLRNRTETLEAQFASLQQEHEKESQAKSDELAVLKRDLLDFKEAQRRDAAANLQELTTISQHLNDHKVQLEAVRAQDEQNQKTLNSMKDDLAKGVQSALTQQVVKAAADLSVHNIMDDKTLIKDQGFLKAIAKLLATGHRNELRGADGASGDNEVIANMLKADPMFLDSVSVSVLMQNEDGSALNRK